MSLKVFLLLSLIFFSAVTCEDEEPPSMKEDEEPPSITENQLAYMKTYGYLKEGRENNLESVKDAIKNMQVFGGLKATGQMNDQTAMLVDAARCGAADLEERDTRGKRFLHSKNKWLTTALSYKIFSYPTITEGMTNADVDAAILNSFKRWSGGAPKLVFTKTDADDAILKIRFFKKTHPDKYPFDDKGKVLGHAFYPRSGNIHFDDDEIWTKTTPKDAGAKYLEFVATHEIGHALGLKHSGEAGAVMRAYYPGYNAAFALGADDIAGIKALYA